MKKKFLLALLTAVCAITLVTGLSACDLFNGEEDAPPQPTYFTVTFETNGGTPIDPHYFRQC